MIRNPRMSPEHSWPWPEMLASEQKEESKVSHELELKAVRLQSREPVERVFRWGKFNFELVEQQVYGNPFRNTVYFGNHWLNIKVQQFSTKD